MSKERKQREGWFNWRWNKMDIFDDPPQTDDQARQYVPQTQIALSRYEHYRNIGLTPSGAAAQTVADLANGELPHA